MIKVEEIENNIILNIQRTSFGYYIIYKFHNLILISKRENKDFCPNCIFLYNLDSEIYTQVKKSSRSIVEYIDCNYDVIFESEEKKIISQHIVEISHADSILILDLNNSNSTNFSKFNTYHHFLCPCDTYHTEEFSKHIGNYAIFKSIDNMNDEIVEYLNHSFFKENFVYFTFFYNPLSIFDSSYHETDLSIGIDSNDDRAMTKSLMESIERYSLFLPRKITNNNEIDSNTFCLIKDHQRYFQMATSNGFAASPKSNMTEKNAINEVLERDSLMTSWIYNTNIEKINLDSLPSKYKKYVYELKQDKFDTYIFSLNKNKNIYCFLILTINEDREPFIKSGLGSHDKRKDIALNKAFGELLIGIYFDYRFPINNATYGADFHLNYYRTHENSLKKMENIKPFIKIDSSKDWEIISSNLQNDNNIELFDYTVKNNEFNDVTVYRASQEKLFPLFFKGFEEKWCKIYFTEDEIDILQKRIHPFP